MSQRQYDIRAVAEITGMNPITLRAWEQRYKLVVPKRAGNGRRVYTQDDLDLITIIVNWVKQGIPISRVEGLLQHGSEEKSKLAVKNISKWDTYKASMLKAVNGFKLQALDDLYNEVISTYPFSLVLKNLIKPIFTELGDNWQKRQIGIANEHFFSDYIRNKIGARLLFLSSKQLAKHTLLIACLPGEQHELGLLCFELHARENGFNCISLGRNLPLEELERAIAIINPTLSVLYGCLTNEIVFSCKKIIKKTGSHLAIVERHPSREYNFCQQGLYKLSDDFDLATSAIQKIISHII